jgi:aspartate-semialdehyde dehydrogenase
MMTSINAKATQKGLRIGIVGATGAVGQALLDLLERRGIACAQLAELRLWASAQSSGVCVRWGNQDHVVRNLQDACYQGLDWVFLCANSAIAQMQAPLALSQGARVIDCSMHFRMSPEVPLVIPQINGHCLAQHPLLIASPNCSATLALMALGPLHRAFYLEHAFIATYQAVSGQGLQGLHTLLDQTRAYLGHPPTAPSGRSPYPHPIAFNVLPQVGLFEPGDSTQEENKLLEESRKILEHPTLRYSCTCVRVPTLRCHSLAIHAQFAQPVCPQAAREVLQAAPGVSVLDNVAECLYPTCASSTQQTATFVGRIRADAGLPNGLALWVCADQLWKGAALNALEIMEHAVQLDTPAALPAQGTAHAANAQPTGVCSQADAGALSCTH